MGQSRDNHIIVLFKSKYKRRWIDVVLLQDKHNTDPQQRPSVFYNYFHLVG